MTAEKDLTLAVLLPDGVGFRNFVFGPFLKEASANANVHIFQMSKELPQLGPELGKRIHWHKLLPFPEKPLPFILRQTLMSAYMHWVDTPPMHLALKRTFGGSLGRRAAMSLSRWIGKAVASPTRMDWVDWAHRATLSRSAEVAHFKRVFSEIKPDVIFCSNQSPLFVIAPVLAAQQLGIPTATFIFSWDNLSSKGRILAPFDHFLLWSDQMRRELHRFYPRVRRERTHVIGTPQFDPYADKSLLWSRAEFCRRIGADPARKIICYSGGDEETSKADPYHVRALMELIRAGEVEDSPQVLLRPAPIDPGKRYEAVRKEFPELLYAQPRWVHHESAYGGFYGLMPTADDVKFLCNLTHHADLNINFASTMTLDFAIHDKPVINVVFEVTTPPLFGTTMWEFVRGFEHYNPVVEFGAARFAHTADELAEHVNAYLANPSLDRENRKRFVDLEVGAPIGESSYRIVQALEAIGRGVVPMVSARRAIPA